MNDLINVIPEFVGGILIGAIFFGGLWLTIQKGLRSKSPGLWFVLSFVTRMGIALAGFYYASQHSWQKMILCLAGFLIARTIIVRITAKHQQSLINIRKESAS